MFEYCEQHGYGGSPLSQAPQRAKTYANIREWDADTMISNFFGGCCMLFQVVAESKKTNGSAALPRNFPLIEVRKV